MWAVVVRTTIHDPEGQGRFLREEGVRLISQTPGFVSGHWVRFDATGTGSVTIVFESQEDAEALAHELRFNHAPTDLVTLNSIEVGEVIASG